MPEVVVILTPAEGKLERFLEVLRDMAKGVQLHEPDVPRYHVTLTQPRGGGKTQIMMIESYATEDALKFHKTTEHYFKMMDALEKEGLVDGDMIHEIADVAMGFTR